MTVNVSGCECTYRLRTKFYWWISHDELLTMHASWQLYYASKVKMLFLTWTTRCFNENRIYFIILFLSLFRSFFPIDSFILSCRTNSLELCTNSVAMASSGKRSSASLIKPNAIKPESNRGGISPHVRIKSEPNLDCKPLPSTERLSSFRLPRDLTLGGLPQPRAVARPNLGAATSNKKVYTPNLNAVRNKNV